MQENRPRLPRNVKLAGAASLFLWTLVIICGRLIPYLPRWEQVMTTAEVLTVGLAGRIIGFIQEPDMAGPRARLRFFARVRIRRAQACVKH